MALLLARETSFQLPVKREHIRISIVNGHYLYFYRPRLIGDYYIAVSVSTSSSCNMSQARVTDFFLQRKKGIAAPVKPAKQRSSAVVSRGSSAISTNVECTRSKSSKNKDDFFCPASVHEEFVRVIDEAAGLNEGEFAVSNKDSPSGPRTPKRTSAEFDLGAAVFSATADHSTAKKRRHVEAVRDAKANVPEKVTKKKARKKLVLPQNSLQVLFMLLWSSAVSIFDSNVCQDVSDPTLCLIFLGSSSFYDPNKPENSLSRWLPAKEI